MDWRAKEYERRMRALGYGNSLDRMDDEDIEAALARMDRGRAEEPALQGLVRIRSGVDRDLAERMFRRFARPFDPNWQMPDLDGPGYIKKSWPDVMADTAGYEPGGNEAGSEIRQMKGSVTGGSGKDSDANWWVDPKGMFPGGGVSSAGGSTGSGTLDRYRTNEIVTAADQYQASDQTPGQMKPSGNLAGYLKTYEDFKDKPYQVSRNDPPTIGFGHVILPGEDFSGGITEEEALKMFQKDLEKHAAVVNEWAVKNNIKLKQQQFDALVSFVFNVGSLGVENETQIIADTIKKGNATPDEIRRAFGLYVRNEDGVQPGLVSRRRDEADMFSHGDYRRKE